MFNSIAHHDLAISRAAFSGGESPYRYVSAFGCDLFLSTNADDVRSALDNGVAAATLLPSRGGLVILMSFGLRLMGTPYYFLMRQRESIKSVV